MKARTRISVWVPVSLVFVGAAIGRDARAQVPVLAPSATSAASSDGGMGMMAMMYAMRPSAALSPTDAAALGGQAQGQAAGQGAIGLGGMGMNGGMLNPITAPMLLGNGFAPTPQQFGAYMLLNQAAAAGIGSGQISGVRPSPGDPRTKAKTKPTSAKARPTTTTPGGLAAKYFNRTSTVSRIPQRYYARANRFYPQVAR